MADVAQVSLTPAEDYRTHRQALARYDALVLEDDTLREVIEDLMDMAWQRMSPQEQVEAEEEPLAQTPFVQIIAPQQAPSCETVAQGHGWLVPEGGFGDYDEDSLELTPAQAEEWRQWFPRAAQAFAEDAPGARDA